MLCPYQATPGIFQKRLFIDNDFDAIILIRSLFLQECPPFC